MVPLRNTLTSAGLSRYTEKVTDSPRVMDIPVVTANKPKADSEVAEDHSDERVAKDACVCNPSEGSRDDGDGCDMEVE